MARRRGKSLIRDVKPDSVHNSVLVSKFINSMMWDGKRSTAEKIFYSALGIVKEKMGEDGFIIFEKAVENVKPAVQVKSRRVGGATYQVPVEVYPARKQALGIKWIIKEARIRSGKSMQQKLAAELMDAYNNTGGAVKKKEEVKRMAEANKAFSHYAW
ncbi:MAG: 30S ribosomal protein S7 [Spirochaetia bacterium]|nr:30S ribosomal protein S7 [Spirochaetia bacterium]